MRLCAYEGMFVKDRWGWVLVSMCWKWVDLIYTGLTRQGREGALFMHLLPLCFLPLPFALCFLTYARRILSSPSSGLLRLLLLHCNPQSLSADLCLSKHFPFIFICGYFILFCLFLFYNQRLWISDCLTHSSSIVSCLHFLLTLRYC